LRSRLSTRTRIPVTAKASNTTAVVWIAIVNTMSDKPQSRFEANLFYANANFFVEEILRLVTTAKTPIRGLVLDLTGIDDIDYTAAKMLLQVRGELNKRGVTVVSVIISADAIDNLRRYGLAGEDFDKMVYPSIDAAVAALGTKGNAPTTAQ
jgi:MFS superfamily sulfate permease-like transporter